VSGPVRGFGPAALRATIPGMNTARLEAFSDGVLAIIITIMVLDLRVPVSSAGHADHLSDLWPLRFVFFSYVLSFVNLAIYWNNHHHMLFVTERVSGAVLWANMHLLFWLSLMPFATAWMGENHFAATPTAVYGVVLLLAALAYYILQTVILREQGKDSLLAQAIGRDVKGKVSPLLYVAAIGASFWQPLIAYALYVLVAAIWLLPDRRIERALAGRKARAAGETAEGADERRVA
jgi:uncharacterized membrane protein